MTRIRNIPLWSIGLLQLGCVGCALASSHQLDEDCFVPALQPSGPPQPGDGGYDLEVESTIAAGSYLFIVNVTGNVSFEAVVFRSSSPGWEVSRNGSLRSGSCDNSATNANTLQATSVGITFATTSTDCVNFELAVVRNSSVWFTNITTQACPDTANAPSCGSPPDFQDFSLVKSSAMQAVYRCRSGYALNSSLAPAGVGPAGEVTAACTLDGLWENITAVCDDIDECQLRETSGCHECRNTPGSFRCLCNSTHELVTGRCFLSCGHPGNITHGSFQPAAGPFAANAEVRFSCDAGYQLEGQSLLTCSLLLTSPQAVNWSNPLPSCTAVKTDSGLSYSTRVTIIVISVLAGVTLVVVLVVVLVVSHTRRIYKTMAKRHSQSSLQSAAAPRMVRSMSTTSTGSANASVSFLQGAPPVEDNRRSARRNSRMERRNRKFSSESVARAKANEFQLTAAAGDIVFSVPQRDRGDGEDAGRQPKISVNSTNAGQFGTESTSAGLLGQVSEMPSTDYAAIGPKGEIVP